MGRKLLIAVSESGLASGENEENVTFCDLLLLIIAPMSPSSMLERSLCIILGDFVFFLLLPRLIS